MAQTKVKILSLGLSQSNFLNKLYGLLKDRNPSLSFSVDRYRDLSKGTISVDNPVFEEYYDYSQEFFTRSALVLSLFKTSLLPVFWKYLWFELRHAKNFKEFLVSLKNQGINRHIVDNCILPEGFDLYHFHFCTQYNLRLLPYLPKNSNIICSFWGSDLYRNHDKRHVFYVKDALNRATAVTIQTPEMGTYMLEKYGDEIKEKVTYAQFAIETDIYHLIDTYREDKISLKDFKGQLSITPEKHVITIGYNANEAFQHIETLEVLRSLPKEIKDTFICILPLTYSRDSSYLLKLNTYLASIEDLEIIRFDEFMGHNDIAKLRLISDIQIQVPISDALSGSVTEVLYAGNVVVSGAWLPYSIFKIYGINLKPVEKIEKLDDLILEILSNLEQLKHENKDNASLIARYFFPDYTMNAWHNLYDNLTATT